MFEGKEEENMSLKLGGGGETKEHGKRWNESENRSKLVWTGHCKLCWFYVRTLMKIL